MIVLNSVLPFSSFFPEQSKVSNKFKMKIRTKIGIGIKNKIIKDDTNLIKDEIIKTSPGYIEYEGFLTSDFKDYGTLSLSEVISKSSNVVETKPERSSSIIFWSKFSLIVFSGIPELFK